MAIDYDAIIHTDLTPLKDASKDWKRMGERFGELEADYRRHVRRTVNDTWQGESELAYRTQGDVTLEEYGEAKREARAVSRLLAEAHSTLSEGRKRLLRLVREAREAGMNVDSRGRCTLDVDRLPENERPASREAAMARRQGEEQWTDAIAKQVKAVQEDDHNLRLALAARARDNDRGTEGGFDGGLKGDAGHVNSARAKHLLTRLGDGDDLSRKERQELDFLLGANKKDPEFSRAVLNSLGPEGTIETANRLNDLTRGSGPHRAQYGDFQQGLATTLATATKVPEFKDDNGKVLKPGTSGYAEKYREWEKSPAGSFYRDWRADMRKAGVETYTSSAVQKETWQSGQNSNPRGYQTLVTLMRQGDSYSPQFLHDVADDIRAAEEREPGVWNLRGGFHGKDGGWFANDPYDGVLGVMAKDPDTAATYLDPKSDPDPTDGKTERNDRLAYLIKERKDGWEVVNGESEGGSTSPGVAGGTPRTGPVNTERDKDAFAGFEDALKAAATGRLPDTEASAGPSSHSAANASVMEETVRIFGKDPDLIRGDGDLVNLRPTLGKMISDYPGDVQHPMYGDDTPAKGTRADFRPGDLANFLYATGRDPDAYASIVTSQETYTAYNIREAIGNLPSDADKSDARDEISDAVRSGAKVSGILSEAKAAGMYEDAVGEAQDYNARIDENSKWVNRFVGAGIEFASGAHRAGEIFAAPATWLQEDLSDSITERMKNDVPQVAQYAEDKGRYDFAETEEALRDHMEMVVKNAAEEAGVKGSVRDSMESGARGQAGDSFGAGSNMARGRGNPDPAE
ncbi:hypothetical protein E0L36_04365 [Streptomyces sp. AJS327]|uniref:DUF6571 family protein n=1 Tax=Streptomyces sp. AJS327 TaxID=2545265 RepID=UPI0015DE66D3|nr:DUF6571 family protein [Streptomyces sp. AJS327]MBA0050158.1 hypothetical protein [Streptomyces sp. AJS327]